MNREEDATVQHRPYRFGDPDRTGWLLGPNGVQCVGLGAAVFLAGLLLSSGQPFPVVLLPVGLGAVYAFARVGGVPAHEWLPVMAMFFVRRSAARTIWEAALPLLGTAGDGRDGRSDLPPCLRGVSVIEVPSPAGDVTGIAVVKDDEDHTISTTIPVRGRAFSLLDPAERDRLVAGWGDSFGGFCADGSPVAFVRWSEWAAPVGLPGHLRHLEARRSAPADAPAVGAYRELLDEAGAMTVGHEVLITIAVDTRRVRSSRNRGRIDDPVHGCPGGSEYPSEVLGDDLGGHVLDVFPAILLNWLAQVLERKVVALAPLVLRDEAAKDVVSKPIGLSRGVQLHMVT